MRKKSFAAKIMFYTLNGMKLRSIIFFTLLTVALPVRLIALDSESPIIFPVDEVVAHPIVFFWEDRENLSDAAKLRFSLTLSDNSGASILTKNYSPETNGNYFVIPFNDSLSPGDYRFSIQCFRNDKEVHIPFYSAYHYPVTGFFTLAETSTLPAYNASFPTWYAERHQNKLENGYNALFFASAGTTCGVVAYLMLSVFDFNIWTRIIGYVFAASSATGYGASAYYGWNYFSTKAEIDRRYGYDDSTIHQKFSIAFHYSW